MMKFRGRAVVAFVVLWAAIVVAGCGKVNLAPIGGGAMGESLTTEQRFVLKNIDGQTTDLSQVLSQKKLVLLNFWATWCTYCVEEMPDLVKLQAKNESRGFTVLAVNVGESVAQASDFAKKFNLNFPVVVDETSAVAQAYGLVGIPVSYLVASDGKIIGEYHGFTPKMIADVESNLASS